MYALPKGMTSHFSMALQHPGLHSRTKAFFPGRLRCSPFPRGIKPGAGVAIPGAVGIPGEAAVSAGGAVDVAAVQGYLGDPFV